MGLCSEAGACNDLPDFVPQHIAPVAHEWGRMGDSSKSLSKRLLSRRSLLRAGAGMTIAGLCTGLYTWRVEPTWLSIERRKLKFLGLPNALHGKRLIQLSDLHVGRTEFSYLQDVIHTVNRLKPDLVAITGDFM